MCWITLINFVARMGEINRLDEPCSVITVILRPLGHAPLGWLEKQARKEGQGEVCRVAPVEGSAQAPLGGAVFLELGRRRPP